MSSQRSRRPLLQRTRSRTHKSPHGPSATFTLEARSRRKWLISLQGAKLAWSRTTCVLIQSRGGSNAAENGQDCFCTSEPVGVPILHNRGEGFSNLDVSGNHGNRGASAGRRHLRELWQCRLKQRYGGVLWDDELQPRHLYRYSGFNQRDCESRVSSPGR